MIFIRKFLIDYLFYQKVLFLFPENIQNKRYFKTSFVQNPKILLNTNIHREIRNKNNLYKNYIHYIPNTVVSKLYNACTYYRTVYTFLIFLLCIQLTNSYNRMSSGYDAKTVLEESTSYRYFISSFPLDQFQ